MGDEIEKSIEQTHLYRPADFEEVEREILDRLDQLHFHTQVSVHNETTLEGAAQFTKKDQNVGVLNFASAKNPGGEFLGGAQSQEESIAQSSSLYASIAQMKEMYDYNKSQRTYLYSDYMIFSRDVVVFRNDALDLLVEPYTVHMVTSPAVNVGAIRNNASDEMKHVEEVMMTRIDKMLGVFVHQRVEHLVLGAWGCGVFRNDPEKIAEYFFRYLNPEGKYGSAFKTIRFSVLDTRNSGTFDAFRRFNKRVIKKE